ncbi:terpenoid cyclases/Protein prenyltransferase [Macrolepiota fuliginosa MF-IS2]|uniref:Protein farnesyltransferase subunit beta n=1 Tax=Macrolepiota fuliginosa MF-IS2 TaxID=1400762 RepID=A0A9P5XFV5_9AGAR|nr:terpenoid cyclases/Protein prenyltransferase [Macrolepiota fuliginosa MF-IS2]
MTTEHRPHHRHTKPTAADGYPTATSLIQQETENILLEHGLSNGEPTLQKNEHLRFLARNMLQGFPAQYSSQDASQPWLLFWTLQAFSVLQVGLDPGNRQRAVNKILAWQHPKGGFCGGPGQSPHLLPTYAAVCALAIVGKPGPGGGWDEIDRAKLYDFFMSLKQPDGSFRVAEHMEVDVRGIYCLLVTATLLDIVTPELVKGTATFLASCQTYEGGFSSASHPFYSIETDRVLRVPRPNLGEAHGGYTFCALASWVLLQNYLNLDFSSISGPGDQPESQWDTELTRDKPEIDVKKLTRWLVDMQGSEIELGGFKGRTNKLVDGCYSWWCGGAFVLLEALGVGGLQNLTARDVEVDDIYSQAAKGGKGPAGEQTEEHEGWDDIDESLFNRKALQEYILLAGQHPAGGLRDKPPKAADSYHTLYCLSGLSAAQHHLYPSHPRKAQTLSIWKDDDSSSNALRKAIFCDMISWVEEEGTARIIGPATTNRLNATHPLTNLTISHTEGIMKHFYGQEVPPRPIPKPTGTKKVAKS